MARLKETSDANSDVLKGKMATLDGGLPVADSTLCLTASVGLWGNTVLCQLAVDQSCYSVQTLHGMCCCWLAAFCVAFCTSLQSSWCQVSSAHVCRRGGT